MANRDLQNGLLDVTELMTTCTAEDFHGFDVRITADEWGRTGKGDQVVVVDSATHIDISEPLIDMFAEALARYLHASFPDTKCKLHMPYERSKRPAWSFLAACTCTLVFESRLRAAIRDAKLNQIDIMMAKVRIAQQAQQREKAWMSR